MWTVPRKYSEFYVLEQKLTEFHGRYQIYYSKFDRITFLIQHKTLTNDLIESKIET